MPVNFLTKMCFNFLLLIVYTKNVKEKKNRALSTQFITNIPFICQRPQVLFQKNAVTHKSRIFAFQYAKLYITIHISLFEAVKDVKEDVNRNNNNNNNFCLIIKKNFLCNIYTVFLIWLYSNEYMHY